MIFKKGDGSAGSNKQKITIMEFHGHESNCLGT